MSAGFLKDGRQDSEKLTAKELREAADVANRFAEIARLLRHMRTVGDVRVVDRKVDELMGIVE